MWPRWIGRLGYRKTGMGMMLLREYIVGPERFDTAFREYIDDWAFKSPQPADFFRSIEDGAGMELDWFYRTWFLGTGSIDIAIVDAGPAEDHESAYVTFVNKGDIPMPVPYRVTFDDGSSVDLELPFEAWGAADKYRAIIDAGGRAIRSVQIDPRGLMPDVDLRNNRWGG
jgi:aminopeptidase N